MRVDVFVHIIGGSQGEQILKQGELIMASLQDLKDQLATLATDIAAEKAEVQALLTDLKAQIKALQDQIAAGSPVTQADLDALSAAIAAVDAGVKDISEPPAA